MSFESSALSCVPIFGAKGVSNNVDGYSAGALSRF